MCQWSKSPQRIEAADVNSTLRDLNLNLAAEDGVQGVDWPEDPGQETSPLDELREWYEGLNPRPSGIDFDLIREGGFGGSITFDCDIFGGS